MNKEDSSKENGGQINKNKIIHNDAYIVCQMYIDC